MNPVVGALRLEHSGSARIGAIRAFVTVLLVAASALDPGLAGRLIDGGVDRDDQGFRYAAWGLGASLASPEPLRCRARRTG